MIVRREDRCAKGFIGDVRRDRLWIAYYVCTIMSISGRGGHMEEALSELMEGSVEGWTVSRLARQERDQGSQKQI